MNNRTLFRYSGIAALVSALCYVASLGVWMSADPQGAPPAIASTLYNLSSIIFLLPLYTLSLFYRSQGVGLTLLAALLLAVSTVGALFIDPTDLGDPLVLAMTGSYGIGAILLAVVALRSPWTPRGMGILVLLLGGVTVAMLPFMLAGFADLVGIANLVVGLLYTGWLLWLAGLFLKGQFDAYQAA